MIMVVPRTEFCRPCGRLSGHYEGGVIIALGEASTVLTHPNLDEIFRLKAEATDPFNDGSVVVVLHPRGAFVP